MIEIGYDDQQVFKDALGTSQSYVSKTERGEGLRLLIALVNLCSVLDCSLDYLSLRTDDPHPYFPDVIDELTIMYQPENVHHRAMRRLFSFLAQENIVAENPAARNPAASG